MVSQQTYNRFALSLQEHFLLDPIFILLDHGSFDTTPKSVFEAYQNWQLHLERQPILFLRRELDGSEINPEQVRELARPVQIQHLGH